MDESLARSDFGDCRCVTLGTTAGLQISHHCSVTADGEPNLNLEAGKDQEGQHQKLPSMDNLKSSFCERERNFYTAEEAEVDTNNLSFSTSNGACASINPVDSCDMTRHVSINALPPDSLDYPSPSTTDSKQLDYCSHLQQFHSSPEGPRLIPNDHCSTKITYSKSELPELQNKHRLDNSSKIASPIETGPRTLSTNISSDSSRLLAYGNQGVCESIIQCDEKAEMGSHMNEAVPDKDYGCHTLFTGSITLDQLNDDVLFHIASFLEARVLRYALSLVCRRFYAMFANDTYWRTRIALKWPKRFPAVSCTADFNWLDACIEREDTYRVWRDIASNKNHFKYSYNLFGEVDAVHLMKEGQLAVCGDRSRVLSFFDLTKYPGPDSSQSQLADSMLCHTSKYMHQGWIWSIASAGNQIVTGSWDTHVRIFDFEAGCQLTSQFKCHSSVLCLYAENSETVASCSDKTVYFFDHRTSAVRFETFHTQPVLCVAGNENFIISGSEDRSVSVFDRRAWKTLTVFKLKNYPLCMSYTDNQLWFGDRTGTLHLCDATDGLFQNIGSYDIGHTEKMTGIVSTRGAIYTCSGDRTIKVLHPTREPDTVATLAVHEKEVAKIDYNSGVLISAGGDYSIGVWLPKHWGTDTYLI